MRNTVDEQEEDLTRSQSVIIKKHQPIEEMTPYEAYAAGYREGAYNGSQKMLNLFAKSLPPEVVVDIIGG